MSGSLPSSEPWGPNGGKVAGDDVAAPLAVGKYKRVNGRSPIRGFAFRLLRWPVLQSGPTVPPLPRSHILLWYFTWFFKGSEEFLES